MRSSTRNAIAVWSTLAGSTQASGKFAGIEGPHDFQLAPWRRVIHYLGRQISGIVRNGGISWDFTRKLEIGSGCLTQHGAPRSG
jgi:hypothetical protein